MAGEATDIREAIRQLASTEELSLFESTICTVSNINTTSMTCDCSPVNGDADFLDVLLCVNGKNGFVLIPKNNSFVAVTQLNESDAFVSMVSEVDGILLNGDTNGGLIKIDNLKTQYDANIAAIKTAVAAGFTSVDTALNAIAPGSGVSTAAFNASAASILNLNKTPLENTKVKHG